MMPRIKICGITTAEAVEAASSADYLGFIFFSKSPRNITPKKAAALAARSSVPAVAVTVNPDDDFLKAVFDEFAPGYIQLHGDESPARVRHIKDIFKTPVIKAIQVRAPADMALAGDYEKVADMLLFDAKTSSELPGGNGVAFDWNMLAGKSFSMPWFLSGGLTINNVEEALRITGARMVDVSSSLESVAGIKDPKSVQAFIKKVKTL